MATAGETWVNRVTGERVVVREGSDGERDRLVADLYVAPGGAVAAEHLHPTLDERFTIVAGRVGVLVNGVERIAEPGEVVDIPRGTRHDWWNAGEDEAHVVVEVEPARRFEEMIVTVWGLANAGRTDAKGRPGLLQLAAVGREFSDVMVFTQPPQPVQRVLFGPLAWLARRRGLRGSYPEMRALCVEDPAPRAPGAAVDMAADAPAPRAPVSI
jgi:quercetin dioxygenase-like cupin family protein